MAELFTDTNTGEELTPRTNDVEDKNVDTIDESPQHDSDTRNNEGLTMEEVNDANKIKVTIADYKTPIVILFGPPSCGKTMTLVRLTRYLSSSGYTVQPDESFRPLSDKNYSDMCKNFDSLITSDDAAQSTSRINFMLVKVFREGKPLCQILEGPGEYYFNPDQPKAPFPSYVNVIINSKNRKIWAIMLEPSNTNSRMDTEARKMYALKINKLKTKINARDKIIFVYNKVDTTPFVVKPGVVKYSNLFENTKFTYPNVFASFTNTNPITRWWKPYNFDFAAFQTGDFSKASDGTLRFDEGPDIYPKKLWDIIMKRIMG
jgi:hypothetical protein